MPDAVRWRVSLTGQFRLTVRAVPLPDAVPPELPALHPLAAGRRYLPLTLAPLVIAPLAGALIGRAPARVLIAIGLGMPGVGMIWMSALAQPTTGPGCSANSSSPAPEPGC